MGPPFSSAAAASAQQGETQRSFGFVPPDRFLPAKAGALYQLRAGFPSPPPTLGPALQYGPHLHCGPWISALPAKVASSPAPARASAARLRASCAPRELTFFSLPGPRASCAPLLSRATKPAAALKRSP